MILGEIGFGECLESKSFSTVVILATLSHHRQGWSGYGYTDRFIRNVADFLAREFVHPLRCFIAVFGLEAGNYERHFAWKRFFDLLGSVWVVQEVD